MKHQQPSQVRGLQLIALAAGLLIWSEEGLAQTEPPLLLGQLTQLLQRQYGVRVSREACAVGTDGYYDSRTRRAVVCQRRTRSELEVVAHESIHVMQDAADGKLGNGFAIPLGWAEIQLEAPIEARLKLEHTVTAERQMEREAWWAETLPLLVLQLMQRRCGLPAQQTRPSAEISLRQLRLQNCILNTNPHGML